VNTSYDLAVAWRIYPGVSKTPLIFNDNKFLLAKTCLASFIDSVAGLSVRYFFILDGCPPSYAEMIRELFPEAATTIIETPSIGNLATFRKQVELLLQQTDAEYVYFAEDDYLYVPGSFGKMIELIKTRNDVDFVSCYLHPDTFSHPIHRHKKSRLRAAGHNWMSDSSTCLTFLTSRSVLEETKDLLLTYSKGNNDCAMWLVLTRTFIYNPIAYIRFFFTHKESFSILKVAVKYSFRYFFKGRRYRLWIPDPAIGTHLEKDLVSPGVDWLQLRDQLQDR
jgi:hypothetical protein